MNIDRLDTFPSTTISTIPPPSSKRIQTFRTNEDINFDNSIQNNKNSLENNLKIQNKNLQKKITVLTGRIKVYENEYFEKTNSLTNQIKNFNIIEMNYKNQIDKQNTIIGNLKKENEYLKNQINEMEENVSTLKKEIKNIYRENLKNENKNDKPKNYQKNKIIEVPKIVFKEKEINNPETERQLKDLIHLIKKYSKEISKLKNENLNLSKTLNFNESIVNKSFTPNNISYLNNDSFLLPIANFINKEINLFCQWIDTYMGDNYDKNFDFPSLVNEEIDFFSDIHDNNNLNLKLKNYLQFDLLKKSLEKSKNKINNILNESERKLIEYKTLLNEIKIKNSELKEEINKLNNEIINLNDNKIKLSNDNQIDKQSNQNIINGLKEIFTKSKEENEKFLTHLYDIILKELNDILRDDNYKSFHKNILNDFDNFNNINDMLNNSVEKLIQFLQFLKYEYTKMKNENPKNLTLNSNENL
jgi:hypothetical protein